MTSHGQAAAVVVAAVVRLVERHPNCASIYSDVSITRCNKLCEICSPHIHVLHRGSTVGVGEPPESIRLPHLGTDRLVRCVAIASECTAVCFLHAWWFGFVLVVWNDLSVWRQEARVSAVWSAVALVVVWIYWCSCVGRSGMAQLF